MKLLRKEHIVKNVEFGDKTSFAAGCLVVCKDELQQIVTPMLKHIESVDFELVHPGENTRIVHLLDTILPMYKPYDSTIIGDAAQRKAYPGIESTPVTVGDGVTHVMRNFSVMECAALPWDENSASSGLLYPRDAILDMTGPISQMTPFAKMHNLVIVYKLHQGSSSVEYDNEIRIIGMKIAAHLAEIAANSEVDKEEIFSIDEINPDLPNVVLAWNCQSQGPYASTFLYGHPIDNLVPTILHPNEVLDGCVVSGNYVWPAFKVPTYLQTDHPILLELYRQHGKTLNFRGIVFGRSHNPSHWHKQRCAAHAVMLAKEYLQADGLIMAWEGGGNAAVDGMLTIQYAEQQRIKCTGVTFEFGGVDGREGVLMVDDVPEATAMVSGGSIEKPYTLPKMERAVGGDTMRLNKESGGYFPEASSSVTFDTTTHFYLGGNQCGASTLFAEAY